MFVQIFLKSISIIPYCSLLLTWQFGRLVIWWIQLAGSSYWASQIFPVFKKLVSFFILSFQRSSWVIKSCRFNSVEWQMLKLMVSKSTKLRLYIFSLKLFLRHVLFRSITRTNYWAIRTGQSVRPLSRVPWNTFSSFCSFKSRKSWGLPI